MVCRFKSCLFFSKGFFQSFGFDKSNIARRHVRKILHCPGFAFFKPLLVAAFATLSLTRGCAWCGICSKCSPMHRLVKKVALHGCIETTRLARCNIWIMHHRNCILQDARGQLSFAICNVFKMHHRKHGLRDACDWFPLQGASGRLGLPSYGGVEYWVVGGEEEDGETLIKIYFFFLF